MKLQAIYPVRDAEILRRTIQMYCRADSSLTFSFFQSENFFEMVGPPREIMLLIGCMVAAGVDSLIEVQQVPA